MLQELPQDEQYKYSCALCRLTFGDVAAHAKATHYRVGVLAQAIGSPRRVYLCDWHAAQELYPEEEPAS